MHKLLPLLCFACIHGCAVGPDFEAPEHSEVVNFMGATATPQSEALAGWKQIYNDPHLQKLISRLACWPLGGRHEFRGQAFFGACLQARAG